MHDPMQEPDIEQGANPELGAELPNGEIDREGAMAKADLYKLANYSQKLFKKINDEDQLEGWVQAKITKAADYIASVFHYMEYEMQFSEYGEKIENSDMYTESQKEAMKNLLAEAKSRIKDLKKEQAGRINESIKPAKKVAEGVLSGGERPCTECGGTGMVYEEPKEVPAHVKAKVEKYNRQAKAFHAAGKRIDRNKNGIPDELEGGDVEEGFEAGAKPGDTFKTAKGVATKTKTGVVHKNTSFNDEEHGEANTTHAKSKSAAEKKSDAPKLKKSKSGTWGMEGGEKFDNRKKDESIAEGSKVDQNKDGKNDFEDVKIARMKAAAKSKSKKVEEGNDGNLANNAKPYGKVTKGDVVAGRLGKDEMGGKKKAKSVKESTGGYSAKDAAAGKDLGKPGKNFEKIAKDAAGRGGKKVAGAVLKNLRKNESVDPAKANILEAIAKAKARMEEGSIQGGVWVSSPDKGVPPPSDPDGGSASALKKPAAKKPATGTPPYVPSKKSGTKKAETETDTAVAERMDESVERIKALTSRLVG